MKKEVIQQTLAGFKLCLAVAALSLLSHSLSAQHHGGDGWHNWNDSVVAHTWNDSTPHHHHLPDSIPPVSFDTSQHNPGDTGTHASNDTGNHIWNGGGHHGWGDTTQLGGHHGWGGQVNDTISFVIDTTGNFWHDTTSQGSNDTTGNLPPDSIGQGWNDTTNHFPIDTTPPTWNDTLGNFPPDSIPQGWGNSNGGAPFDTTSQGFIDSIPNGGPNDTTGCHNHRDMMATTLTTTPVTGSASLYPNPMHESATLVISGAANAVTFRMFESSGRVVSLKTNLSNGTVNLQRESLSPGLYFYEMLDGNKVMSTGKLIIQ